MVTIMGAIIPLLACRDVSIYLKAAPRGRTAAGAVQQ